MYYFKLEIDDEDKKMREHRDSIPAKLRDLAGDLGAAKTQEERELINSKITALRSKITPDVLNSVCGDKEVINILLATSSNIKSSEDVMKYSRMDAILRKAEDPGWIALDDDTYKWVMAMMTHEKYNFTVRTDNGSEVQAFPPPLKIKIGEFLDRFKSASEKMPEDYKGEYLSKTAKKFADYASTKTPKLRTK